MRFALLVLVAVGCGSSEERVEPTEAASSEGATADPAPGAADPETDAADDDWEPPPYDYEILEPAERDQTCAESGEPHSAFECTEDTDCRVCHDGSDCGTPVNLEELRRRGPACQQQDAAECEYSAVRCCEGRCKSVGY